MQTLRFGRAASDVRPKRAHRFDVFGPKVGRRLTIFGLKPFQLWLRLETNPGVSGYCERPLYIPDVRPPRLMDFWAKGTSGELLYLVLRSGEEQELRGGVSLFPDLRAWCHESAISLVLLLPSELVDSQVLCSNRLTLLRYSDVGGDTLRPERDELLLASKSGTTLHDLEQKFPRVDRTQLHAAAFKLVLSGQLRCPTLAKELLGPNSWLFAT